MQLYSSLIQAITSSLNNTSLNVFLITRWTQRYIGARYITNSDLTYVATKITIPLRSGNEQLVRWTSKPKLHQTHNWLEIYIWHSVIPKYFEQVFSFGRFDGLSITREIDSPLDSIEIPCHMGKIIVFMVCVQFASQRITETRHRSATRNVPLSRQISRRLQRFTKLIPRCN